MVKKQKQSDDKRYKTSDAQRKRVLEKPKMDQGWQPAKRHLDMGYKGLLKLSDKNVQRS